MSGALDDVAAQTGSGLLRDCDGPGRVGLTEVHLEVVAVLTRVWRTAQAVRGALKRGMLRPDGVSWGGFSLLLHLWIGVR